MAFISSAIADAFKAHGLESCVSGTSVYVGSDLQVDASTRVHTRRPDGVTIQLDVRATADRLGRSSPIFDSFAGVGENEIEAEKNAFRKFLVGSFHVLAESLTDHKCDSEQVEWETWHAPSASWKVCSGPLLTQATVECRTQVQYGDALTEIQNQFLRQAEPGAHWMRIFLGFMDGKLNGIDAILDGEHWTQVQAILEAIPWAPSMEYESLRHLLIVLPGNGDVDGSEQR